MMKISIIGAGYVGLVTGVCLAELGHRVQCVDVDATKVALINAGQAPIHEEGLPELLARLDRGRFSATTDLDQAVRDSELTFIAVGTPAVDGMIDLTYVRQAAEQIGVALRGKTGYHTVVVKSTVIPGTTDGVVRAALEQGSMRAVGEAIGLGMNPEFLTEGQAMADFRAPDRLVIGGVDDRSRHAIARVYESFAGVSRFLTNCKTAEMIKYTSNSVLATLISFSNEIGRLCTAVGDVDVADVMQGVHAAAYFAIGSGDGSVHKAPITSFLEAGCGFGGSCLPKDVTALVAQGRALGVEMPLLSSVLSINRSQPAELLSILRRHKPELSRLPVTVLGLAFKPGTDDLRESPAFPIVRELLGAGAAVTAFDPVAKPVGHAGLRGVTLADNLDDALRTAEVVIHVTKWPEFEQLGALLRKMGRNPLVLDGRRNLTPADFEHYEGVGRRVIS